MPENTVYVGRPTLWGNPWTMAGVRAWLKSVNVKETYSDEKRAENLVMNYRLWVESGLPVTSNRALSEVHRRLPELRGKHLACWCRLDRACHADVLLELANRPVIVPPIIHREAQSAMGAACGALLGAIGSGEVRTHNARTDGGESGT